ncbi:hypothetical protein FH609_028970 [Streptomyces sp. 3MP-14]|uniref:Aminoacyl-transfer RNA synthetases class-II family profile domain-containing protein n=1 Tax=Streptomyces mimosae TaxID=2586635 RepID=A0A5N5ZQN8_9ACTN|nr:MULTISPECIES: His/Gly/Thr/Pro-type tRNA ligase C-terminal domain-containing protein [Streptomyces]KAB8158821.1 hypothetical protein FH607_028945 [Streptomyces mimosae]KAB8172723.1 hypothetical protein FH609_028970 [Streptomyces sp. 3MP-14]
MSPAPLAVEAPGGPGDWVVTPEGVAALAEVPAAGRPAALDRLVEQEIAGRRVEPTPPRVAELLAAFGFGWEPLTEPGHMRAFGHAALMLGQAKRHAAAEAGAALDALGLPRITLDGVRLVDADHPRMRAYTELTRGDGEVDLYGDEPYRIDGGSWVLRQTACFQKYALLTERTLADRALPVALFEISDSFRREPAEALRLAFRQRRFHLPEAHLHTADVAGAAELALPLHRRVLRVLGELDAKLVLLVNATHEFAAARPGFFTELVARADAPALVRIGAPGALCMDGVEVDVEYKVVDALGCPRELSTWQIDHRITASFGLRGDEGGRPATVHTVLTGGVERYVFLALDRIARREAAGERPRLPLWLTPVVARVVPADAAALGAAGGLADRLAAAGVRTELDDRDQPLARALAEADALLVPHVLRVGADGSVELRSRPHETFRACPPDAALAQLAAEVRREALPPPDRTAPRLTRHPLGRPGDRRENWGEHQRDEQRDDQQKGTRHGEPA